MNPYFKNKVKTLIAACALILPSIAKCDTVLPACQVNATCLSFHTPAVEYPDGSIQTTATPSPGGIAGGDLQGVYPNPFVRGASVPFTATSSVTASAFFGDGSHLTGVGGGSSPLSLNMTVTDGFQYPIPLNVVKCGATISTNSAGSFTITQGSGNGVQSFSYTDNFALQPALTSLTMNDLVCVIGSFSLAASNIATFSAPALTTIGGNFTHSFPTSSTATFPVLTSIQGDFTPQQGGTSQYPLLTSIGGTFAPNSLGVTSTTFSSLAYVNDFNPASVFSGSTIAFNSLAQVETFRPTVWVGSVANFIALSTMATYNPNWPSGVSQVYFPNLKFAIGGFTPQGTPQVSTFTAPSLINLGGTPSFYGSFMDVGSSLRNVTIGTVGTFKSSGDLYLDGQNLSQVSVDYILHVYASLDGTNGTTSFGAGRTLDLSGGTNSAPSAAGLTDKATIVGRGATVSTHP